MRTRCLAAEEGPLASCSRRVFELELKKAVTRVEYTAMLLQRTTECRICGVPSERAPSGRVLRGYPLLACGHCGALQIKEAPTPAELKALYDGLFEDGDYAEH